MKFKNHFSIILLTALFSVISLTHAWAQESKPGEVIVATINKSLKILNDPALQSMDKFKERRQRLWDTVKPIFDFRETSRRTLGRHWLILNAAQKEEFTETFVQILRDSYLGKSDSYRGEKIVYVRELSSGNRGKVQTNFFTTDQKKVVVDFSMHKVNGTWKVYDIIIEGVSIVSNYRSQFNSILAKESFDDLMEKLTKKKEELSD